MGWKVDGGPAVCTPGTKDNNHKFRNREVQRENTVQSHRYHKTKGNNICIIVNSSYSFWQPKAKHFQNYINVLTTLQLKLGT